MAHTLSLTVRAFRLPKQGHAPEEIEDAFACSESTGRFAVADGASESAFSGTWADTLVQAYVATPGSWSRWLPNARSQWLEEVSKRELPWYAEAKVEEGAYAALLGLVVTGREWRAEAVGDSCLFQIRDSRICHAFPVRNSADFGVAPSLLGACKRLANQPKAKRLRLNGHVHEGDSFLLMTDAMAQWFLKVAEVGGRPWIDLQSLESETQFAQWLESRRTAREIRNDDVTLMCVGTTAT